MPQHTDTLHPSVNTHRYMFVCFLFFWPLGQHPHPPTPSPLLGTFATPSHQNFNPRPARLQPNPTYLTADRAGKAIFAVSERYGSDSAITVRFVLRSPPFPARARPGASPPARARHRPRSLQHHATAHGTPSRVYLELAECPPSPPLLVPPRPTLSRATPPMPRAAPATALARSNITAICTLNAL